MSPIDEVYSRIQEITNRIREIQSLGRQPPGNNGEVVPLPPGNRTVHPAALSTGSQARAPQSASASTTQQRGTPVSPADLAASGTASFDSLLNEALSGSSGSSTAPADNSLGLSGLGDLGGIDTLLGTGSTQSGSVLGSQDTARLQEYQNLLLQAVRELQSRTGTNNGAQTQ